MFPHLRTYPFIKVWHAGCSAGQEVYSMGILLEEESMKQRAQVYATDFNESISQGILKSMSNAVISKGCKFRMILNKHQEITLGLF